ncbi:hypothetical protein BDW02DRAFT_60902 [Decorospora gaudefroyi]|uniref:Uncharacterized protein n=1 Tax=Decorospora gaudefroyi TaxID=184978 RepID=A0A6A5K259_9PLEO|nr:hypothetical protein BDW02DRAFT_60902 [Decorospora gaudefroyi]
MPPNPTVISHTLPPTRQIPNSPLPLLHYPSLLHDLVTTPTFQPTHLLDLYTQHGWQTQWIAKYGPDIPSHYHSTTHECMTVISGSHATIRFGVADGEEKGGGGVEIKAQLGDVFIVPAGVAHKTFSPEPSSSGLAFYQPEDIAAGRAWEVGAEREGKRRRFFEGVELKGEFMMMGAYPYGGVWDFAVGGEHAGREEEVWRVPVPDKDPVLGDSRAGLVGLWEGKSHASLT